MSPAVQNHPAMCFRKNFSGAGKFFSYMCEPIGKKTLQTPKSFFCIPEEKDALLTLSITVLSGNNRYTMPLAYRALPGLQAEDIMQLLKPLFTEYHLDTSKLLTFTADGASVNGVRRCQTNEHGKNIVALLRRHVGHRILAVHCAAHRLQLCAGDAFTAEYLKDLEKRVSSLYKIFLQASQHQDRHGFLCRCDRRTATYKSQCGKEPLAQLAEAIAEASWQLDHCPCTPSFSMGTLHWRPWTEEGDPVGVCRALFLACEDHRQCFDWYSANGLWNQKCIRKGFDAWWSGRGGEGVETTVAQLLPESQCGSWSLVWQPSCGARQHISRTVHGGIWAGEGQETVFWNIPWWATTRENFGSQWKTWVSQRRSVRSSELSRRSVWVLPEKKLFGSRKVFSHFRASGPK